jgi:hypothetical protein
VRSYGKVLLEYCSSLNECLPAMVADNKASGLSDQGGGNLRAVIVV